MVQLPGGPPMILHIRPSRISRLLPAMLSGPAADTLAAALGRRLDDAWHYVGDAPVSGERLDAVVVGPGGTWTLTRARERGRFRKRNDHWYAWNTSTQTWVPWEAHPVLAARLAGHRLELHLDRAGLPPAVEACLVTGRGMQISWEPDQRPGVHVHAVTELDRLARRMVRDEVLTQQQVDRIVALLDPRQPLQRLAPTPQG